MHEHAGEYRGHLPRGIGSKAARHKRPLLNEGLPGIELNEKHQDIQRNERQGHNRKTATLRIVIT